MHIGVAFALTLIVVASPVSGALCIVAICPAAAPEAAAHAGHSIANASETAAADCHSTAAPDAATQWRGAAAIGCLQHLEAIGPRPTALKATRADAVGTLLVDATNWHTAPLFDPWPLRVSAVTVSPPVALAPRPLLVLRI